MNPIDMKEIPSNGRLPFSWLDKRIVDCLDCGKRIKSTRISDLHKCPQCGSRKIAIIKNTRIPYRTLTQARDEGRLLVYPDNPTETSAAMLADWRNNPRSIKANSSNQIKRSNSLEAHNHTGAPVSSASGR